MGIMRTPEKLKKLLERGLIRVLGADPLSDLPYGELEQRMVGDMLRDPAVAEALTLEKLKQAKCSLLNLPYLPNVSATGMWPQSFTPPQDQFVVKDGVHKLAKDDTEQLRAQLAECACEIVRLERENMRLAARIKELEDGSTLARGMAGEADGQSKERCIGNKTTASRE